MCTHLTILGATNQDTKDALRILKDHCFKVDTHLMPNLPGSTPEKDKAMFEAMIHDPDLQSDQWKIYPCEVTPWTVIEKWYTVTKEFVPYPDEDLIKVSLVSFTFDFQISCLLVFKLI